MIHITRTHMFAVSKATVSLSLLQLFTHIGVFPKTRLCLLSCFFCCPLFNLCCVFSAFVAFFYLRFVPL